MNYPATKSTGFQVSQPSITGLSALLNGSTCFCLTSDFVPKPDGLRNFNYVERKIIRSTFGIRHSAFIPELKFSGFLPGGDKKATHGDQPTFAPPTLGSHYGATFLKCYRCVLRLGVGRSMIPHLPDPQSGALPIKLPTQRG